MAGDSPNARAHQRVRHDHSTETAEDYVEAVEARIDVDARFGVPGLKPEENGAAEGLVRAITGDNATHVVSYGTEAGQFQEAGYSAVVCGPGDIAQAHQPDEFLTVAQFDKGQDFMARLVDRLAG